MKRGWQVELRTVGRLAIMGRMTAYAPNPVAFPWHKMPWDSSVVRSR